MADNICESLRKTFEEQTKALVDTTKRVEERIKLLSEKEAKWNEQVKKIEESASRASQKIKLDVGGKPFNTSKGTLMSMEGTYFHAMLGSGKFQPDEEGVYFIDRNPKHFDVILDYLRMGELNVEGLDTKGLEKVKKDCDYYQIPLPKRCQRSLLAGIQKCAPR